METKILEIRDRSTFIPMLAVKMVAENEAQGFLLRSAGYSPNAPYCILMMPALGGECRHDPYDWNDRTFMVVHGYIEENFDKLNNGDVIDVEFILGEAKEPKVSQRTEF